MAKICVIADLDQYHTRRWIGNFLDDNEVTLIYFKDDPRFKRFRDEFLAANLGKPGFRAVFIQLRRFNLADYLRFILRLNSMRKKYGIKIFYVHYAGIAAFLSSFIKGVRYVLCPWGSDILIDPYKSRLLNMIIRRCVRRADIITANSKHLAEGCKKLGAQGSKIRVIQIGIDLNIFRPGARTAELKKKLSIEGSDKVVLSARNFRELYNIDMIVRSIPDVVRELPDVKYVLMAGQGADEGYAENIKAMASDMGIADKVIFVEAVQHVEMPGYYCMSDVVISVPSSDSSPSFLHEAMACGIPPVVSDLPAVRELFVQGVNAEIVPQEDHGALARATIELLKDDEKRRRYAAFNLDMVRGISDIRKNVSCVQSIFDGLDKNMADQPL